MHNVTVFNVLDPKVKEEINHKAYDVVLDRDEINPDHNTYMKGSVEEKFWLFSLRSWCGVRNDPEDSYEPEDLAVI